MSDEQPLIADILGVTYRRPISDAVGWAAVLGEDAEGPPPPKPEMFNGLLGDLTRTIAPHVPWDPIAFHVQSLVAIGNYVGFGPYMPEGATNRRANLFAAIIGGTGQGKGSSLGFVRWLMMAVDEPYMNDRWLTAIGSGEGLLSKITDTVMGTNAAGNEYVAIEGSPDKRVLYVEEELGALFNKMVSMESVEKQVTKAWDSGTMETVVKNDPMKCLEPHVSIIGHITPDEFHERLDKRLLDNGFSNRWLMFLIKPTSKVHLEPMPHDIPGAAELASKIARNARAAAAAPGGQMVMTSDAQRMFEDTSDVLTEHKFPGALKKQNVRWRSQMFKLSVVYAIVDGANKVEAHHFEAARATWAYNARSASAFFAGLTGHAKSDEFLAMWRDRNFNELTLTDITDMFSNHMTASKRDHMLNKLKRQGLIELGQDTETGGRPATTVQFTGNTHTDNNPSAGW